jgi:alpha-mannosidase
MIGNAHLDPIWLWDWREGLQEALDTCWSAVARLRETEDFVFTRSSAAIYQWIEEADPELFEEIRSYVAQGRWEIVGGWWEQADCNLPAGESLVRHCLYGKRYFLDRFGVEVRVGYNPDSFGHNAGIPQILRRAGYEYYLFCRPDPKEKYLPDLLFSWEGPDGSRVLAYRPPLHYASWGNALQEKIFVGAMLLGAYATSGSRRRDLALMYGVGNHGGGPTRENLATIQRNEANPEMPRLKFARLEDFFHTVAQEGTDFPVVTGDLQYHSRGCYTSLSQVKWYNRECEMRLMAAERAVALLGRLAPLEVAPAEFESAWRRVLFNQFHDILGGCSIRRAYADVFCWHEEALVAADGAMERALGLLCSRLDTAGQEQPVLIFNPLPWARCEAVQVDEEKPARLVEMPPLGWTVVDAAAEPHPLPPLPTGERTEPHPLPPLPTGEGESTGGVQVSPTSLENDVIRVEVAPGGALLSLVDKRRGRELLAAPGNVLVVVDDPWDTWGHDAVCFRDDLGAMEADGPGEVLEAGPARGRLGFRLKWGDSTALLNLSLTAGSPRVDFDLVIDWHERLKLLKVSFPLALEDPVATFEQAYTAISLPPDGSERPAQTWIDVTGRQGAEIAGVALLNDCKYGFDVLDAEMRMTLLRSPAYAWHMPRELDPDKHYWFIDQGGVSVSYALLAHLGGWQEAAVPRAAWALNNPPLTVALEQPGDGEWPAQGSLAEVGPESVIASVFKPGEEGGTIARVYETTGAATRGWLALPHEGRRWEFSLAPWEIKTFLLPEPGAEGELEERDLLERPL